jgi:hypothetical protein
MLWTVESLRMATAAGAEDYKRVALANLSAWQRQLIERTAVFPQGDVLVLQVAFSPDGKTVLTGGADKTARLWDAATGQPIGAGLELDERGTIRVLDGDARRERRHLLEQFGGLPPDRAPRLDPILFGAHPEARGEALAARGLWNEAEVAYVEAARARPLDAAWRSNSIWGSLTRFYLSRGCSGRAVSALDTVVSRWTNSLDLRYWQCVALVAAGDQIGWEEAIASLLDRFHGPMPWEDSNIVAWLCAMGPYPVASPELPVRLAESAVRGVDQTHPDYANCLNTLGAALYRAGRFEEAIRRL